MPDQEKSQSLFRLNEARKFLQISRSKLYLLMDTGELPFTKFGKSRRIPKWALTEFVQRHTQTRRPTGS